MKKLLIISLTALTALTACKQSATTDAEPILGSSQLNVESLLDSLDYKMDISQLTLSDLRILRNAPAAKRGYPFQDSYLRGIYGATTWYDSLMWVFDETKIDQDYIEKKYNDNLSWRMNYYEAIKADALNYSDEEREFMDRVKKREDELLKNNFNGPKGTMVNVANVINPDLMKPFDATLQQQLAKNGFAIVPARHDQLFHVYEQNDYHQFPSFVTTDLYLQLYHLYFDAMLREVEQQKFRHLLSDFCSEAQKTIASPEADIDNDTRQWLTTYFNVASALLTGKEPKYDETAKREYNQVMKSENATSDFLGYKDVMFEYSLFRPRGHYTRNDTLGYYFRTMMWLQTVPFQTDNKSDMKKVATLAELIGTYPEQNRLYKLYQQIMQPLDYLMGKPDDVSILQAWQVLKDEPDFDRFCKKVDEMAEKQTRIRPKFQRTSRNKVRLMPQRYQPDAEVMQEMVDYDSEPTKRAAPNGLDIFAAMGSNAAERILVEELNEPKRWDGFKTNMERMKKLMDSIDWQANIVNQWLAAINTLDNDEDKAPYFMKTDKWQKKTLNSALGSWAELKHDAILYAKQPYGAECGGGGVPNPIVKGYVEPNVKFWKKAISLLENTDKLFKDYGLYTQRLEMVNERMKEELEFLLKISEKELKGEAVLDVEYDQLEYIGATFENLSLEMLRGDDVELWEWNDVQGPEKKVALIADVYTANADNNPKKSIVYAGVGDVDELYVIIEIDGYLYLMRGGVFSYRELTRPYGEQRMNDEEWQKLLEKEPHKGVPSWMEEIIVPLKEAPVDNDEMFYSSGC